MAVSFPLPPELHQVTVDPVRLSEPRGAIIKLIQRCALEFSVLPGRGLLTTGLRDFD
jgi:hypothetical protein